MPTDTRGPVDEYDLHPLWEASDKAEWLEQQKAEAREEAMAKAVAACKEATRKLWQPYCRYLPPLRLCKDYAYTERCEACKHIHEETKS